MPIQQGPTPWWNLPEYRNREGENPVPGLQAQAPAGYEYDPVRMAYGRTPTSSGTRLHDFTQAAMPGMTPPSIGGIDPGGTGGFGGGTPTGGTGTGGGYIPPPTQGTRGGTGGTGTASTPRITAHPVAPDMTKSNAASFARAKDQVGQVSRASLDSLSGEFGAQGMAGGGGQMQSIQNTIQSGAGELGDVSREQAVFDASQKADFAKMGYEGDITQRGQDITQRGQDIGQHESAANRTANYDLTGYQGGITQRGQDISREEAQARLAMEQRNAEYQRYSLMLQGLQRTGSMAPPDLLY